MEGYKTIKEWEKDRMVFLKNPNDYKFLENIKQRLDKSAPKVRDYIRVEMENDSLDKDPWMVFESVLQKFPDNSYILKIRSRKDPWFLV